MAFIFLQEFEDALLGVTCIVCENVNCPERDENAAGGLCSTCGGHVHPLPEDTKRLCFMDVPCTNIDNGCFENLPQCRMLGHGKICPYQLMSCKICHQPMTILRMKRHLRTEHHSHVMRPGRVTTMRIWDYGGQLLSWRGDFFWLWCKLSLDKAFVGVLYLGKPNIARKYTYRLDIKSPDGHTHVTYEHETSPITQQECEIEQAEDCFAISREDLIHIFAREGHHILLKISIKKTRYPHTLRGIEVLPW